MRQELLEVKGMGSVAAPAIRNGVNVTQLVETIDLIKRQPEVARFKFRARTRWEGGGRSATTIEGFHGANQEIQHAGTIQLAGDEPAILLGTDTAANAVEAILHAIASCMAVGFAYNAAAQGIDLEEVTFESEGDLDLHAFLGLSEKVRPGFERIHLAAHVKADAPREKLEALCSYVQRTSPVLDIVRNPVPVAVTLAR